MIFFPKLSLEEDNDINNIENYYYMSNPCLEEEDSENDYPQKFTFNKYRTDDSFPPINMMDYSTALQSNKIFEDIFQDKKEKIEKLNEFNNMNNFIQKQEPKEKIDVIIPIMENNNNNTKVVKKKIILKWLKKINWDVLLRKMLLIKENILAKHLIIFPIK